MLKKNTKPSTGKVSDLQNAPQVTMLGSNQFTMKDNSQASSGFENIPTGQQGSAVPQPNPPTNTTTGQNSGPVVDPSGISSVGSNAINTSEPPMQPTNYTGANSFANGMAQSNQPNATATTQSSDASSGGGINFGNSVQIIQPNTTTTQNSTTNSTGGFNFGNSGQTTQPNATTTQNPTTNSTGGFNFGNSAQTTQPNATTIQNLTTNSTGGFNFGNSAKTIQLNANTTLNPTINSTGGFNFGNSAQTTQPNATTTQNPTTNPSGGFNFGNSAQTTQPNANTIQNPTTNSTGGFNFGNSAKTIHLNANTTQNPIANSTDGFNFGNSAKIIQQNTTTTQPSAVITGNVKIHNNPTQVTQSDNNISTKQNSSHSNQMSQYNIENLKEELIKRAKKNIAEKPDSYSAIAVSESIGFLAEHESALSADFVDKIVMHLIKYVATEFRHTNTGSKSSAIVEYATYFMFQFFLLLVSLYDGKVETPSFNVKKETLKKIINHASGNFDWAINVMHNFDLTCQNMVVTEESIQKLKQISNDCEKIRADIAGDKNAKNNTIVQKASGAALLSTLSDTIHICIQDIADLEKSIENNKMNTGDWGSRNNQSLENHIVEKLNEEKDDRKRMVVLYEVICGIYGASRDFNGDHPTLSRIFNSAIGRVEYITSGSFSKHYQSEFRRIFDNNFFFSEGEGKADWRHGDEISIFSREPHSIVYETLEYAKNQNFLNRKLFDATSQKNSERNFKKDLKRTNNKKKMTFLSQMGTLNSRIRAMIEKRGLDREVDLKTYKEISEGNSAGSIPKRNTVRSTLFTDIDEEKKLLKLRENVERVELGVSGTSSYKTLQYKYSPINTPAEIGERGYAVLGMYLKCNRQDAAQFQSSVDIESVFKGSDEYLKLFYADAISSDQDGAYKEYEDSLWKNALKTLGLSIEEIKALNGVYYKLHKALEGKTPSGNLKENVLKEYKDGLKLTQFGKCARVLSDFGEAEINDAVKDVFCLAKNVMQRFSPFFEDCLTFASDQVIDEEITRHLTYASKVEYDRLFKMVLYLLSILASGAIIVTGDLYEIDNTTSTLTQPNQSRKNARRNLLKATREITTPESAFLVENTMTGKQKNQNNKKTTKPESVTGGDDDRIKKSVDETVSYARWLFGDFIWSHIESWTEKFKSCLESLFKSTKEWFIGTQEQNRLKDQTKAASQGYDLFKKVDDKTTKGTRLEKIKGFIYYWDKIKENTSSNVMKFIIEIIERFVTGAARIIEAFYDFIASIIKGLWSGIKKVTSSIWTTLELGFKKLNNLIFRPVKDSICIEIKIAEQYRQIKKVGKNSRQLKKNEDPNSDSSEELDSEEKWMNLNSSNDYRGLFMMNGERIENDVSQWMALAIEGSRLEGIDTLNNPTGDLITVKYKGIKQRASIDGVNIGNRQISIDKKKIELNYSRVISTLDMFHDDDRVIAYVLSYVFSVYKNIDLSGQQMDMSFMVSCKELIDVISKIAIYITKMTREFGKLDDQDNKISDVIREDRIINLDTKNLDIVIGTACQFINCVFRHDDSDAISISQDVKEYTVGLKDLFAIKTLVKMCKNVDSTNGQVFAKKVKDDYLNREFDPKNYYVTLFFACYDC